MPGEKKKVGVLLIENNTNIRSFFSNALKATGSFAVKVAANTADIFDVISALSQDDIHYIIINSNLQGENFCSVLQKLKTNNRTFSADVILISNEVDEETRFLLDELGIKTVFPQGVEADAVIKCLNNFVAERASSDSNLTQLYQFKTGIQKKDLALCQEMLARESFKLFIQSSEQYLAFYGEYLILKQEYEQCFNILSQAVKNHDSLGSRFVTVGILNCYAKVLCHLEKFDDAESIYKQMEAKSPKNLGHKLNICQVHLAQGRWQPALDILEKVLEMDPTNDAALLKSAQAHVGLGKTEEAKKFLDKVAGKAEINALMSFYNNRGVAYARSKKYEKALEFYKSALFFSEKESSKIIFNIGICLLKFNQYDDALKIFTDLQNTDEFNALFKNKSVIQKILNGIEESKNTQLENQGKED